MFLSHTSHCADFKHCWLSFLLIISTSDIHYELCRTLGVRSLSQQSHRLAWGHTLPSSRAGLWFRAGLCTVVRGREPGRWGRHELWNKIIWVKLDKLLNLKHTTCKVLHTCRHHVRSDHSSYHSNHLKNSIGYYYSNKTSQNLIT